MIVTLTFSEDTLPGLDRAIEDNLGFEARRRPLQRMVQRPLTPVVELLKRTDRFAAIAISSPRGARVLRRALHLLDDGEIAGLPFIWCAGPATQAALPKGMTSGIPERGAGAVPLARAMIAAGVRGAVLYLCSSERRGELPEILGGAGILVQEQIVYDMKLAGPEEARELLGETDLIVIASHQVLKLAANQSDRPGLITLGPSTATTAEQLGWTPIAVAEAPTVDGVVDALYSLFFAAPGPQSSPSKPSSGL